MRTGSGWDLLARLNCLPRLCVHSVPVQRLWSWVPEWLIPFGREQEKEHNWFPIGLEYHGYYFESLSRVQLNLQGPCDCLTLILLTPCNHLKGEEVWFEVIKHSTCWWVEVRGGERKRERGGRMKAVSFVVNNLFPIEIICNWNADI